MHCAGSGVEPELSKEAQDCLDALRVTAERFNAATSGVTLSIAWQAWARYIDQAKNNNPNSGTIYQLWYESCQCHTVEECADFLRRHAHGDSGAVQD